MLRTLKSEELCVRSLVPKCQTHHYIPWWAERTHYSHVVVASNLVKSIATTKYQIGCIAN